MKYGDKIFKSRGIYCQLWSWAPALNWKHPVRQDNDLEHTSKLCKEQVKTKNYGVLTVMDYPPWSLDLNPT